MSCSVKIKALNRLKKDGVISSSREILNYDKFNYLNELYTETAVSKYGLQAGDKYLFDIETNNINLSTGSTYRRNNVVTKFRAVPNDSLFNELEQLVINERSFEKSDEVDYRLKSVDILSSDKGKQMFAKGKKNNWDLNKILTELQVPKVYKDIILNKELKDREDIITSLLSDNSFVVEINTAKSSLKKQSSPIEITKEEFDSIDASVEFDGDPESWSYIKETPEAFYYYEQDNEGDESFYKTLQGETPNTQYYSNLTVNGNFYKNNPDWEYKEQRITTPLITPSIKGHAQFAEDNDIGWFRAWYNKKTGEVHVLELQSDLFQKGRNEKDLAGEVIIEDLDFDDTGRPEAIKKLIKDEKGNQFLQLLNKNNNWVTFFVKSVVQDSVKKGYEKVLFPKGDTAAKIEGHQTFEEFKKQKEDRIKELENKIGTNFKIGNIYYHIRSGIYYKEDRTNYDTLEKGRVEISKKEYETAKKEYEKDNEPVNENYYEIARLKQELADVESGQTQLSSIANFYENNITNILKKNYSVKEIIDEFGNKWNEVDLVAEKLKNNSFDILLKESNDAKEDSPGYKYLYTGKDSKAIRDKDVSEADFLSNITAIKDLFGGTLANIPVNKFLRNALYILDLNQETKDIIKTLLISRANIKFTDNLKTQDTIAQYDPVTRTIYVNKNKLGTGNVYYAFETILHEIAHDFTAHAVENPKNDSQRQFRDDMNTLYEYYKKRSGANFYGFKNTHEFIAEIFSNPIFRQEIDSIHVEQDNSSNKTPSSILDRFFDFIRQIFGISNTPNSKAIVAEIVRIGVQEYDSNQTYAVQTEFSNKESDNRTTNDSKYSSTFTKELNSSEKVIKRILSQIDAVANKSAYKRGKNDDNTKRFENAKKLINELAQKSTTDAIYKFIEFAKEELYKVSNALDIRANSPNGLDSDYLFRANSYTAIYNTLPEIGKMIHNQYKTGELTKEEYDKLDKELVIASNNYSRFKKSYIAKSKDQLVDLLWKYNTKPIDLRKNELRREWNNIKPTTSKEEWVNSVIDNEMPILERKAREELRSRLDVIPFDLQAIEATVTSEKNLPDLLLKMFSTLIDKADMDVRDMSVVLRNAMIKANNKYDPKGSNNKQRYGKLLETDNEGNYYLISEYQPEFIRKFRELVNNRLDAREKYGLRSVEYKKANSEYIQWRNANSHREVLNGKRVTVPNSTWLNPKYKSLTSSELEFLNKLKDDLKDADSLTLGFKSLISQVGETNFYRLPSIRQSDLDRLASKDIKGLAKDKLEDFTGKVQVDRTEGGELEMSNNELDDKYAKTLTTVSNEERYLVPIHYRNKIDPKNQSLDLPTIILMNSVMAAEFSAKNALEADANLLIDVIGEAQVTKSQSVSRKPYISMFSKDMVNPDPVREEGTKSRLYKKLNHMVQNRIYNIFDATAGRMSNDRVNVLAKNVLGYTANMTLAANWLSGIPNMFQGKILNWIEGVGFDTFSRKDLRWAEKKYWNEMMVNGGLNDIGSLSNSNKLNLMIDKFNVLSEFSAIKHDFEKDNKLKSLFNTNSLHAFNNMGEHYIQATLMLAVMSNIKVRNSKGQYLDSNGNVVSDKNLAMNLYEAFDVKDGILELKKGVESTSFNPDAKLSDLGMVQIQNLINKKVIDLHGQYNTKWQSTLQRYWYGKAITMFRKWLIPGFYRRWRGSAYVLMDAWDTAKKKRKGIRTLEELEDSQQYYSLEERQISEGIYTSFVRFVFRSIIPGLRQLKIELITSDWNNLSDHEKANVNKTIRELLITSMMAAASWMAAIAAMDAPDEEQERMFYVAAYIFKRQQTELMQYYSISDNLRIFRTPFASMNTIEKTIDFLTQMIPPNIDNKYEKGRNAGEYKAWVKFKKLVPVVSQTERNAKDSYNYLENITSY